MRLIPVMDLNGGEVVHAVAGNRHQYRPIHSPLCPDSSPAAVARTFRQRCAFETVYVADLNAIAGSEPAWEIYETIGSTGLKLLLDAGVDTADRARRLADYLRRNDSLSAVVVGLEAICDPEHLALVLEVLGPERAIFSLDLMHGGPLAAYPLWSAASPLEILDEVIQVGYRRLIVLDLAAVGMDAGPATTHLCRQIRRTFPAVELIGGGGVRNRADVQLLCDAGCDRVLVASALHAGTVQPND